jgi:hypothetical protein
MLRGLKQSYKLSNMQTNTWRRIKMKKYNANSGWFREQQRHRLARLGVKTGRKQADFAMMNKPMYQSQIAQNEEQEVSYEPETFSTGEAPSEEQVMSDAGEISASSEYETESEPQTLNEMTGMNEIGNEPEKPEYSSKISEELTELEKEENPSNAIVQSWGEKMQAQLKEITAGVISFYGGSPADMYNDKVSRLEQQKFETEDRIGLLNDLRKQVLSPQNRAEIGIKEQMVELKRIDKLLSSPQIHLRKVELGISDATKRRDLQLRKPASVSSGTSSVTAKPKGSALGGFFDTSIFPSWDELLHPEREIKKPSAVHHHVVHHPKPAPKHHHKRSYAPAMRDSEMSDFREFQRRRYGGY